MIELAHTIQRGWPETGKELSKDTKLYFPYRYILHIVDGVLQDRIVVPKGLRQTFLQKIHDVHLGIMKSRLLGCTLMYWPNWNNDVETTCQTCDLCRENQSMPTNIPKFQVKANYPGEIYGVNVTDVQGKSYVILDNYYTCCIFE